MGRAKVAVFYPTFALTHILQKPTLGFLGRAGGAFRKSIQMAVMLSETGLKELRSLRWKDFVAFDFTRNRTPTTLFVVVERHTWPG